QLEITNVADLKQQVSFYYEICREAALDPKNFQARILSSKFGSLLILISALEGTVDSKKRSSVSEKIRQEIDEINKYIQENLGNFPPELQSVFQGYQRKSILRIPLTIA
ncbi:MAG: hypothetical protein V2A63_04340, partial [Patescibacteria group bacterium]